MQKKYQIEFNNYLEINRTAVEEESNFIQNENNLIEDNGKNISWAGENILTCYLEVEHISKAYYWFNEYFTLKENMQKYAPNMEEYALNKFIKEKPLNFLINGTVQSALGNIFKEFEKIFQDDLKDPIIIKHIKETISDVFDLEHKNSKHTNFFIAHSFTTIIDILDTPFYKEHLGFNVIEKIKTTPDMLYTASLSAKILNLEIEKNSYMREQYPEKNYNASQIKALETLEINRIPSLAALKMSDYLQNLSDNEKKEKFNEFRQAYKYNPNVIFYATLDFIKEIHYVPSESEIKSICLDIKHNPEQAALENLLTFTIEKAKLLGVMHKANTEKIEPASNTDEFKI